MARNSASEISRMIQKQFNTDPKVNNKIKNMGSDGVYVGTLLAQNIVGAYISTQNWDEVTSNYIKLQKQLQYFKEGTTTKMAMGFLPDHTGTIIPGIVLGAGAGNDSSVNKGYLTKDANGLNIFYVGTNNQAQGISIKADGIYCTSALKLDTKLADTYINSASTWTAKLNESEMKVVLENPAKAWDIPKANLDTTTVTSWDGAVTKSTALDTLLNTTRLNSTYIQSAALDASKFNTKQIILASDTWTDNSPTSGKVAWNAHKVYYGGTEYSITAGNTSDKYIVWVVGYDHYDTYATMPTLSDYAFVIAVNNAGIHDIAWYSRVARKFIESAFIADLAVKDAHIENATITSAKIASLNADKINAGTLTGFTIQTAASPNPRIVMSSNGICSYESATYKHGLEVTTSHADLTLYYSNAETFKVYNDLGTKIDIKGMGHTFLSVGDNAAVDVNGTWDFTGVTTIGLNTSSDQVLSIGGKTISHIDDQGATVTDPCSVFDISSEFIPWSDDTKLMIQSNHATQPYTILELMTPNQAGIAQREATLAVHIVPGSGTLSGADYFGDFSLLTYQDDPRFVMVAQSRGQNIAPPPWWGVLVSTDYFDGTTSILEGFRFTRTGVAKGETLWKRASATHINQLRLGDYSTMVERLASADVNYATNRKLDIMFNAFCSNYTNNYYQQYNAYADSYKMEFDGSAVSGASGGGFKFFARPTIDWGKYEHGDSEWFLCMNLHKNGMVLGGAGEAFYISHASGATDLYIGLAGKTTKPIGTWDFSGSTVSGLTAVFG